MQRFPCNYLSQLALTIRSSLCQDFPLTSLCFNAGVCKFCTSHTIRSFMPDLKALFNIGEHIMRSYSSDQPLRFMHNHWNTLFGTLLNQTNDFLKAAWTAWCKQNEPEKPQNVTATIEEVKQEQQAAIAVMCWMYLLLKPRDRSQVQARPILDQHMGLLWSVAYESNFFPIQSRYLL